MIYRTQHLPIAQTKFFSHNQINTINHGQVIQNLKVMNFYFVNIFQLPFNAYTQSLFLPVKVGYSSHKVGTAGL